MQKGKNYAIIYLSNTYGKEKFKMKKAFMCSLCRGGILGGALYIEDGAITYKTTKLTVNKEYRNLVLPIKEINNVIWKRILFPIATFRMASCEEYTFIIFNKKSFIKYYTAAKSNIAKTNLE